VNGCEGEYNFAGFLENTLSPQLYSLVVFTIILMVVTVS